jgi:prevent-host-death family protein
MREHRGAISPAGFDATRIAWADRLVEVQVATLLAYRVISMQNAGQIPNAEASVAKLYGSELGQRIEATTVKMLGMWGGITDARLFGGTLARVRERCPDDRRWHERDPAEHHRHARSGFPRLTNELRNLRNCHLRRCMTTRRMSAYDARRQFGQLLDDVMAKGDQVVVERHGRAIAAVVPIRVLERLERERAEFVRLWKAAARRADMNEQEAEALPRGCRLGASSSRVIRGHRLERADQLILNPEGVRAEVVRAVAAGRVEIIVAEETRRVQRARLSRLEARRPPEEPAA